jgi:hypothetical protein
MFVFADTAHVHDARNHKLPYYRDEEKLLTVIAWKSASREIILLILMQGQQLELCM